MPRISVDGIGIAYDIIGDGKILAVITPGGRFSKDTPGVRELAQELAQDGFRVLIWDRPNCGESDICFTGRSESRMHADSLAGLLRELRWGPALLVGGSAGSRVALLTAIHHPQVAERLFLLWISGGAVSMAALAYYYCHESLAAAAQGGMMAVADLPGWEEQLRRNPGNRDKMLRQDVSMFIDTMKAWASSFFPKDGSPLPDMLPSDLLALKMPALVLRSGASDFHHPRETSEALHSLIPGAIIAEPPWGDREWLDRLADSARGGGPFVRWPLLAPQIRDFARHRPP
jgi:pimeloyl-ACP methyl ester carboxylesterase